LDVKLKGDLEELVEVLSKLPINVDRAKMNKYINFISQVSFYLALFIELTIVILDKSEYVIQYEGLWFRLTFLLFGLSLITTKRDLKQWVWLAIFGVIGFVSYRVTGRNEILRWVVFIWACHGKDMKKVLKFTFWYTAAGCAVIMMLSVLGIYGELAQTAIYRADIYGVDGVTETRFCFGMGHPNSFHCMMLVLTWLGIYCYHEKIKWYGYLIIGMLHLAVYIFTDSRTGLLMSVGSLGIFVILQYCKKLQETKFVYLLGIVGVIGCVLLSVMFAVYSTDLPIFAKLDKVLTGRIFALQDSNNWDGMIHTWFLWSDSINDNFFDLGIVRFFYWFGVIPGIIYFLAQCRLIWCGYKQKDYMLLALLVVITIYSVFEAHFISDYIGRNYILFFFGMYLGEMLGDKQEEQAVT